MRPRARFTAAGATLVPLVLSATLRAHESDSCRSLAELALDEVAITSAITVPAAKDLPAYCRVWATVRPAISIEVSLPLEKWNGNRYQTGCGADCGMLGRADAQSAFINAMSLGLSRGYATATSDRGHQSLDIFDLDWARYDPAAERDWAWRAVGETHRVATALVATCYGAAPEHRYFRGCSTGGRLAHTAALRYPEAFDGIDRASEECRHVFAGMSAARRILDCMSHALSDRPFTLTEYLAIEPEGNVRHEFVDGELVAMTGTSRAHNTITGNLVAAIRPHLRGTPCRVASADMKVVSVEAARGYYPDVVVSCGDAAEESDEYTESRPRLVVEVLSPSTEAFDRGDKCVNYRRMESLQEYVLVAQSTQAVEVHGRQGGEWTVRSYGPGDVVALRSIELELPVTVIYEDVPL